MSELPLTWIAQKIKIFNSYKSSTLNPLNYPDEVFELFSVPSFPTGRAEILSGKEIGSTKQLVQEGDVLLCKINPRINRVWTVTPSKGYRQIASSEWIVVRSDFHHSDFLKYFFREGSFRDLLCSDVSGVGGSLTRAKPSLVEHYLAMVAPQAEQTRIVEKLDEVLAQVDTIKARLDGIPAILKRFRQSVLAAAVSGRLTEEWRGNESYSVQCDLLGDLAKFIDYRGKTPLKTESGIPLITAKNIRQGYISREPREYIGDDDYENWMTRGIPNIGDVLITTEAPMGYVANIDITEKFALAQRAICLQFNEKIDSYFASIYMRASPFQLELELNATGSTVKGIKASLLKKIQIEYPGIEEQKEIVRLVDQYFAFADTIEAQVKKAQTRVDNLTQSILAKAFRGELVAQDPDDEPAEKLLERIAQARKEAEALAKAAKKVAKTK